MQKLTIKVNSNPFPIDTQWGIPIKFNKVRLSELFFYKPETTSTNIVQLKIDTGGKFDKNIDGSTGRLYFYIKPILKDSTVAYVNLSNCNDWDYYDKDNSKYLNDFSMKFYENNTLISSAHLATNPIYIELTFK